MVKEWSYTHIYFAILLEGFRLQCLVTGLNRIKQRLESDSIILRLYLLHLRIDQYFVAFGFG